MFVTNLQEVANPMVCNTLIYGSKYNLPKLPTFNSKHFSWMVHKIIKCICTFIPREDEEMDLRKQAIKQTYIAAGGSNRTGHVATCNSMVTFMHIAQHYDDYARM